MASYHFAARIIQRSKGESAVAAAAYRAGERLKDEHASRTHNYSRRRGVVSADILLPPGAAAFLKDRETLWNLVERMEGRKDAQLAREITLALPHELDAVARQQLLLGFIREVFVSRGMVADVAIHEPVLEKGDDPRNHHAHVLLTLRQATPTGLRRVKTREWNSEILLEHWRVLWEQHQNRPLERAGMTARVDHRSLVRQMEAAIARRDPEAAALLNRQPEIHLGKSQRRSVEFKSGSARPKSVRVERNANILANNAALARLRTDAWQKAYVRALHRARKPRKLVVTPTVKKQTSGLTLQLGDLFRAPSKTLTGQLKRMSAGLSIWQVILNDRLARHSAFRSRYLIEALACDLVRSGGRQRLRVRELDAPAVPQGAPAPLQPVAHLAGQDRIRQQPRHQDDCLPVGQSHDLGGIDEVARGLAHALAEVMRPKVGPRL